MLFSHARRLNLIVNLDAASEFGRGCHAFFPLNLLELSRGIQPCYRRTMESCALSAFGTRCVVGSVGLICLSSAHISILLEICLCHF